MLVLFRLKLDLANGTMVGQNTTCRQSGRHCPEFNFIHRTVSRENWSEKAELHKHIAPRYGEYVDFTAKITFTEDDLSPSNIWYTILIENPGKFLCIIDSTFRFWCEK